MQKDVEKASEAPIIPSQGIRIELSNRHKNAMTILINKVYSGFPLAEKSVVKTLHMETKSIPGRSIWKGNIESKNLSEYNKEISGLLTTIKNIMQILKRNNTVLKTKGVSSLLLSSSFSPEIEGKSIRLIVYGRSSTCWANTSETENIPVESVPR